MTINDDIAWIRSMVESEIRQPLIHVFTGRHENLLSGRKYNQRCENFVSYLANTSLSYTCTEISAIVGRERSSVSQGLGAIEDARDMLSLDKALTKIETMITDERAMT